jgi:hypothetical protein
MAKVKMGLSYSIPKTATYLPTRNEFSAAFNIPTLGAYNFAVVGNQDRPVLAMNTNAIYLINRITIGATISQENYLSNLLLLPLMVLKYSKEAQRVYPLSIPLVQFSDAQEAVAFFWSDKDGESLTMSIPAGILSQSAELIGVPSIKINISLSIFEITDNGFIQDFKNNNSISRIGQRSNLKAANLFYVD